ncbi:hypothetical protein D3C78_1267660 [compost metagenome]
MEDVAVIVLGAMVRAGLHVGQLMIAAAGGAGQNNVAGRTQVIQRHVECPQTALPTMGIQVTVLGPNDTLTLPLTLRREGIQRVAQIKQLLAALDLLVGPLEQGAEHIIGDQGCLAAPDGAGKSRHRLRGSLGPGMLWHRVVGVLAEFIQRFDGLEAGIQPSRRQRLALGATGLPVFLAGGHIGRTDHGRHSAQMGDIERLQVAQE